MNDGWRLRTYDLAPPGGYPYYEQGPPARDFSSVPTIESQGANVATFRRANGIARATVGEAIEDIDRYTCVRLGGNSTYCTGGGASPGIALSPAVSGIGGCKTCGPPVRG